METLRINGGTRIPLTDVVIRASRSSGPGGQHANMTSSRIEVSFDVRASSALSPGQQALVLERVGPVVRAVSQDARSQARNRQLALDRLADRIREAIHVDAKRRPTGPSRNAKRKRVESKVKRGQVKKDRRSPKDW
ncbi:alternative ribosome rescue aminoacyl-tRNA hydrolase ArfB [Patulibacter sp.]|uniref:alternative ribosome rescue aminoacyl-tRNA hydrolase ArfB n=1 Tax=Patulibacter sp. TaxID=1912859 RepID=UPI0027171888|nr:alternative ribosome rescue aminoacyl-tRNA hydrolase ArfB [Patulibacter sp.]MDO9407127.1 alternative ribosome rescue aminoacyl-tRNA hydrolase ArfB [Patulibacter sp.]